MALLDLSEVFDPLFMSPVEIQHISGSAGADGELVEDEGERIKIMAVVSSDRKMINRLPEELRRDGTISVRVKKSDIPEGFQGNGYDRIYWRGKRFTINSTSDASQWGAGMLTMVCLPEEINGGDYGE